METIDTLGARMREAFRFFESLTADELQNFLVFCDTRQIPSGEILWHEGNDDNYAAFILSGRICIKKRTEFEGKYVIVGFYDGGSVVGELCLLTGNPRSVTAEAMEASDLLLLHSRDFERLVSSHPMLGLKLLKHIFVTTTTRLRKTYDRIARIF
jgi:CRP-like cAMP-binding protein